VSEFYEEVFAAPPPAARPPAAYWCAWAGFLASSAALLEFLLWGLLA
jgi:hypothetical protein